MKTKRTLSFVMALVLLVSSVFTVGVFATPAVTQPSSLTSDGSYVGRNEAITNYYKDATSSDYDAYISTLQSQGYIVLQSYSADGCNYALLENTSNTVYVSFLRGTSGTSHGRMRVYASAKGTPYYTEKNALTSDVCSPKIWQLDVDNYEDAVNPHGGNGGMSYIIRLTDGTFVIIDGGYPSIRDAKNIYSVLKANNVLDTKPVISAWFITHMHVDHYGALQRFADNFAEDVIVEGFFYNFTREIELSDGTLWENNTKTVEACMKKFSGATLYSQIHSGMTLGFAGATVEVLVTHEDLNQSYYNLGWKTNSISNINDTSTVLRFNIAGQKILFFADAETGVDKAMRYTYTSSYLKSDIMQMSHHGYEGVSNSLINSVDPDVVLWPMDVVSDEGSGSDNLFRQYYNKGEGWFASRNDIAAARNCASEIIPSYKNEELSLPYTANTINQGETPDLANAEAAKKAVFDLSGELYIQNSIDATAIRIIGVISASETQLQIFDSFGFEVSLTYNGDTFTRVVEVETVYTTLIANGKPVTASQYGGDYFYVMEINDIILTPESVAELVIRGTATYGGEKLCYAVGCHKLKYGLQCGESGNPQYSYNFNDIINGAWN